MPRPASAKNPTASVSRPSSSKASSSATRTTKSTARSSTAPSPKGASLPKATTKSDETGQEGSSPRFAGKLPQSLGACADRLWGIKQEQAELNRAWEALDAERKAIKEHVIETLPKSEAQGVLGRVAKVVVTTKQVAAVKDWPAFYQHLLKVEDFSLMQKRVSDAAVRERWEAGETVPGVEPYNVVDVSVTKV